jgi:hypothetical protein
MNYITPNNTDLINQNKIYNNNYNTNQTINTKSNNNINSWINNDLFIIDRIFDYDNLDLEEEYIDKDNSDTFEDDNIDKTSYLYEYLTNAKDDLNANEKNNKWYSFIPSKLSNGKRYNIMRIGDYMSKSQIRINKYENLDLLLNSKISLTMGGNIIFSSSIRLLVLLADKVLGMKITQDDDYNIVPVPIFSLFKHQKIKVLTMPYSSMYIDIDNSDQDFILEVLFGNYNVNYRSIVVREETVNLILESLNLKYKVRDCIENYDLNLFGNNLGIIIWYLVDNNLQFLGPEILKAEISFYVEGIRYSKEIDNIEKIEVNNMVGYFIQTNKFNFGQIINFYKNVNPKTDFGIFDEFVDWTRINKSSIEVTWSNLLMGSEVSIEKMSLNYLHVYRGIAEVWFSN